MKKLECSVGTRDWSRIGGTEEKHQSSQTADNREGLEKQEKKIYRNESE